MNTYRIERIHPVRIPLLWQCQLLRLLRPLLTKSASAVDVSLFAAIATEPAPMSDSCIAELTAEQFDRLLCVVETELIDASDRHDVARQMIAHDLLIDVIEPARQNTLAAGTVPAA